jgi:hypothetical protein
MSNASTKDIQRALNAIRSEIDDANQQTRLEVLQLMLAQSQGIVAMARKLDVEQAARGSKNRVVRHKLAKPTAQSQRRMKQQPIKRADNRSAQGAAQAANPVKPLPPQRPTSTTVECGS